MFIRPVGVTVAPADRPAGRPLLRGLLARAAGTPEAGTVHPDTPPDPATPWPQEPPEPPEPPAADPAEHLEPPAPATPTPDVGPEDTPRGGLAADLTQLADLARQGHLTPAEFTAAKARLLRG
ncbi:hypothetical protein ACFWUZ_16445 [Streptomyces sp. NPDC058646]|uniref:hypothetical protein n=1 Tax=Streptomyces sp. NPDC058646 TaxID=3346574 RepID=UPI003666E31B